MFDKLKEIKAEADALKDDAYKGVSAIDVVIGKVTDEQLQQSYLLLTDASAVRATFDNMSKAVNKLAATHDVIGFTGTNAIVHALLRRR